jgi:hypothetical protein
VKALPKSKHSPVLRTDFSDDAGGKASASRTIMGAGSIERRDRDSEVAIEYEYRYAEYERDSRT